MSLKLPRLEVNEFEQLVTLLNDRLGRIEDSLGKTLKVVDGKVDMQGATITNTGRAAKGNDATNLSALDEVRASLARLMTVTPEEFELTSIYFSATKKLNLGNALGLHRLRIYQDGTDQEQIILERSQDSGANWDPIVTLFLDEDAVRVGGRFEWNAGDHALYGGTGSPEGVVSVVAGSLYVSTDGDLYRKTGVLGNTGWKLIAGAGLVTFSDLLIHDDTPTTGVTGLVAKAGAGQGTDSVFQVQDAGDSPKFTVNKEGDIACRRANIDGATTITNDGTGTALLVEGNTGADLLEVLNNGDVGILGDLRIAGDTCNMSNVVPGSRIVATQADGDFEGLEGAAVTAQTLVTSVSTTDSSAIPASIDTTGMAGADLTIANKVNDIISALGAGNTVVKAVSAGTKALTADRGLITSLT